MQQDTLTPTPTQPEPQRKADGESEGASSTSSFAKTCEAPLLRKSLTPSPESDAVNSGDDASSMVCEEGCATETDDAPSSSMAYLSTNEWKRIQEELKEKEKSDPLLDGSDQRFVLFPIVHQSLWDTYKESQAVFWSAEEVNLSDDMTHWKDRLSENERNFIKNVLAFFASSDGIVVENLAAKFMRDVKVQEAKFFYGFQISMENTHSEMYSLLIDTYVADQDEKNRLFNAVETIPAVKRKAEWALRWIDSSDSFACRLIAFAAVEWIFFSGSFCAIYWLKSKGLMPGLCFSNELISRDEGLHCKFACLLYSQLKNKPPAALVTQIVEEAVQVELEYVRESLPVDMLGMNAKEMCQYIRWMSGGLLMALGCERLYNDTNPFDWMTLISLQGKTNFFERKVGEYAKSGVGDKRISDRNSDSNRSGATAARVWNTEAVGW